MIKADITDKQLVLDILTKSFDNNKSVNYLIPQNHKRRSRLYELMEYSFDRCSLAGDVYLSDDRKACALVLYPHKKVSRLSAMKLDLRLAFNTLGLSRIKKTLKREALIKKIQPAEDKFYLWFIGVDPNHQHTGIGSSFLKEIIAEAAQQNLPVYLETSTIQNLPWYKKHGFKLYSQLDLSYKLHFLALHHK